MRRQLGGSLWAAGLLERIRGLLEQPLQLLGPRLLLEEARQLLHAASRLLRSTLVDPLDRVAYRAGGPASVRDVTGQGLERGAQALALLGLGLA